MASGAVTTGGVTKGRERASGESSSDHGPSLVASVAGCTLAAVAVSGLIMYPFHDHSWSAWAWAGLTALLGPCFIAVLDRATR